MNLDDAEAVKWYGLAAAQGDLAGRHNLAAHYCLGRGGEQNYAAAAELFRLSAEQSDTVALYNLACLYHHGQGVEQNQEKALALCRQAAEKGETGAVFNLGCLYYWGCGGVQNYKEAVRWLGKDSSNPVALRMLGECAAKGLDVREHREAAEQECELWKAQGRSLTKPDRLYPLSLGTMSTIMVF